MARPEKTACAAKGGTRNTATPPKAAPFATDDRLLDAALRLFRACKALAEAEQEGDLREQLRLLRRQAAAGAATGTLLCV